ncbi:hypothetical protein QFC19_004987 [Naganishia cerealis]|uniref:Uncharacterized protein n=1 Tax=Naganishia cerealis TaxID=610337 RepID=A0ACC2VSN1_9TREE|nr:hypothetical protein QFC19_004987 [Naganishia cerealis]
MLSTVTRRFILRSSTPVTAFRTFQTTAIKMGNDEYSKQSQNENVPLQDKVAEVQAIMKKVGTSMLTTVGTDGKSLHSRAMYPASTDKLKLVYIYDNTSHKDDEMKHDVDVNVSFLEPIGGDWISVAGNATTTTDRSEVSKYYSASTKAWFADLGDGVHDGSGNDPRVSVLKVQPTEIRYYARKETLLTQAAEVAAKAFGTGGMATPGAIRTITGKEVSIRTQLAFDVFSI